MDILVLFMGTSMYMEKKVGPGRIGILALSMRTSVHMKKKKKKKKVGERYVDIRMANTGLFYGLCNFAKLFADTENRCFKTIGDSRASVHLRKRSESCMWMVELQTPLARPLL